MKKRNSGMKWYEWLHLCFILMIVIVVLSVHISIKLDDARAERFQNDFQKAVNTYLENGSLVTGDKAVCEVTREYQRNEKTYTRRYIPEVFETTKPEELRYLVRYSEGSDIVGFYSDFSEARQRWADLELLDLKTGRILGSSRFYGSMPAETVKTVKGLRSPNYGSSPSESEVIQWVQDVLLGR